MHKTTYEVVISYNKGALQENYVITRCLLVVSFIFLCFGCELSPNQRTSSPQQTRQVIGHVDREEMRSRLIDTYKELWPLISIDQQHKKLPALLTDNLPELRTIGIERVSVLNRDGEATEDELLLVVSLLDDTDQSVRLSAAKLLPEINLPDLSQRIVASLKDEQNEEVTAFEILYFKDNPHLVAIEPVLARLDSPLVEVSTNTLISLLRETPFAEENFAKWILIVRDAKKNHNYPSLLTLEAILGTDQDRKALSELLKSSSESVRIAVADGFATIGYWKPLVQYKNDPVIAPFLIAGLQTNADLEAFNTLLSLRSSVDVIRWDSAALNILKALDTRSFLLADDILSEAGETDLRVNILLNVWKQSENRSLSARIAIAKRTVSLLNLKGRSDEALRLLEAYKDGTFDEDLLSLKFQTAILASSWDSAADVRQIPQPWINEWEIMKTNDPAAAVVIRQQIIQRFEQQLTETQSETLGLDQTSVLTEESTPEQEKIP